MVSSCRQIAPRLSAFAEGGLTGAAGRAVAEHILACRGCRGTHDRIASGVALARRMAQVPAAAGPPSWDDLAPLLDASVAWLPRACLWGIAWPRGYAPGAWVGGGRWPRRWGHPCWWWPALWPAAAGRKGPVRSRSRRPCARGWGHSQGRRRSVHRGTLSLASGSGIRNWPHAAWAI